MEAVATATGHVHDAANQSRVRGHTPECGSPAACEEDTERIQIHCDVGSPTERTSRATGPKAFRDLEPQHPTSLDLHAGQDGRRCEWRAEHEASAMYRSKAVCRIMAGAEPFLFFFFFLSSFSFFIFFFEFRVRAVAVALF